MKLSFAGISRIGQVRKKNEDAILMRVADHGALFLVADGIGGREHGELASKMLCDRYNEWWEEQFFTPGLTFQRAIDTLKRVLFQVNQEIVSRFGRFNAGSTLVLLFLFHNHCLYLSSGDSRIYCACGRSFQQITVDDVYENLRHSEMKFDKASKGKLVGAIGICETPEFSIRTSAIKRKDRFLLCSDGVYRFMSPQHLRRHILSPWKSPSKIIGDSIKEIEANGAKDNYSMIYICVDAL